MKKFLLTVLFGSFCCVYHMDCVCSRLQNDESMQVKFSIPVNKGKDKTVYTVKSVFEKIKKDDKIEYRKYDDGKGYLPLVAYPGSNDTGKLVLFENINGRSRTFVIEFNVVSYENGNEKATTWKQEVVVNPTLWHNNNKSVKPILSQS